MRAPRRSALLATLATLALALPAAPAAASFGFLPGTEGFDASLTEQNGSVDTLSGTHPYAFHLDLGLNTAGQLPDGDLRNAHIDLPPGLLINPTVPGVCRSDAFHTPRVSLLEESASGESCPNESQVGVAAVRSSKGGGETRYFGVFNVEPPYGAPGAIGLAPFGAPIVLTPHVREGDAGLTFDLQNLPQSFGLQRLDLTLWGTPWSTSHDAQRGDCLDESDGGSFGVCGVLDPPDKVHSGPPGDPPIGAPFELIKSFVTLPTAPCDATLGFAVSAGSWQGASAGAGVQSHDGEGHPAVLRQCNRSLSLAKLQLTTEAASSGTGLVFNLAVNDGGGILNPKGIARPAIRRAVVTLPDGLTINPSVAAGLGACTPDQFSREQIGTLPGEGCPNDSKVGEVEIEGMLGLPRPIEGSLFIAKPYDNPFGTLLALYIVARDPERGLLVKSVGKVEPDQHTGRLTVTFDELPRLLYTHFAVSLREGQRSMLITPAGCGTFATQVQMTSWDSADPLSSEASLFPISKGSGGGGCPPPGPPPFVPSLQAGSLNANAGSYTPVYLHMTRTDNQQEITSYSAKLPPGLLAKIAGVTTCPEAAIAAAKLKTGTQELESPSCPASSQIGRTMVGGGVGQVLAWAPGALYLAGPYHGSALSVVAITAAKVGPFDLGTVVVRASPTLDSKTGQVSVDATRSDPIPHLLAGIPIHVRDIRVYADRPSFTLNPTSCDPFSFTSILGGAGADPFTLADDTLATSTDRFQALNCSVLGFKPRLSMAVKGPTNRNGKPSLRAVYRPRPGDANLRSVTASLPRAFFLEQAHIRSVCSTVQFRANACPPSSVYGYAKAFTPLLAEPLQGPVFLRSSHHKLPDLVADLHGLVEVETSARIDSAKGGGLRANFEDVPDAPVTKFVLTMQGGKKGLVVNSRNLCSGKAKAEARFVAQNSKVSELEPVVKPECGRKHRHGSHRRRAGR